MKAVVVLSGGQDSTTCLYWALSSGYDVHAVTFDYGQRHDRELRSAQRVARFAGVVHERVDLYPGTLKGTSPIVDPEAELEQYQDHQSLPGGLEKTFVPMRNQLFLTLAANRAYVIGTNVVITGLSAEDYGGYPDCRPDFVAALIRASSLGTFTGREGAPEFLRILTPLMHKTKKVTVDMALTLAGCYKALALSHTGYDNAYPPTGKDHATLLRAKGFEEAGIPDPLVLRAYHEGLLDTLPDVSGYDNSKSRFVQDVIDVVDWLKRTEGINYVP